MILKEKTTKDNEHTQNFKCHNFFKIKYMAGKFKKILATQWLICIISSRHR